MSNYNVEFFEIKENEINYLPGKATYNQAIKMIANGLLYRALIAGPDGAGGYGGHFVTLDGFGDSRVDDEYTVSLIDTESHEYMVFRNSDPDQPLVLDLTT